MASTAGRSAGFPRSIPPTSATKSGGTCRYSMGMRGPPPTPPKIPPPGGGVNRAELVPPRRDGAHGCGELAAKIRQRQGYELFFEAERDNAVYGREQGAREDPSCVSVEF